MALEGRCTGCCTDRKKENDTNEDKTRKIQTFLSIGSLGPMCEGCITLNNKMEIKIPVTKLKQCPNHYMTTLLGNRLFNLHRATFPISKDTEVCFFIPG